MRIKFPLLQATLRGVNEKRGSTGRIDQPRGGLGAAGIMSRANPIAVSKTLTCSTHSRALAPECPESGRAQRREAFIVGVHYSHRPRLSLSAMVGYHATFDDDTKKT